MSAQQAKRSTTGISNRTATDFDIEKVKVMRDID